MRVCLAMSAGELASNDTRNQVTRHGNSDKSRSNRGNGEANEVEEMGRVGKGLDRDQDAM